MPTHHQALADYHANRNWMRRHYLQEDRQSVLWHDEAQTRATLWNFESREIELTGKVRDLTSNQDLPSGECYSAQACHVYAITGTDLPIQCSAI